MIKKKLAAAGIRLTPQRLAIADFLDGNTDHPSAESIFRAVKKQYPTMSLATVYNTLDALKRIDGVRELTIDDSRRRFDPNTGEHHHLLCRSCGKIVDIHARYQLDVPAQLKELFEITGNHVEFFGICLPCKHTEARTSGQ